MKKIFSFSMLSIIIMTALCVGFTSCGDDDDDGNAAVGTWVAEHKNDSYKFNFKSNGRGTIIYKYEDSYSGTETQSFKFSYSMTGKKEGIITLEDTLDDSVNSYSGSSKTHLYFVVQGEKMVIYYDINYKQQIMDLYKQ